MEPQLHDLVLWCSRLPSNLARSESECTLCEILQAFVLVPSDVSPQQPTKHLGPGMLIGAAEDGSQITPTCVCQQVTSEVIVRKLPILRGVNFIAIPALFLFTPWRVKKSLEHLHDDRLCPAISDACVMHIVVMDPIIREHVVDKEHRPMLQQYSTKDTSR